MEEAAEQDRGVTFVAAELNPVAGEMETGGGEVKQDGGLGGSDLVVGRIGGLGGFHRGLSRGLAVKQGAGATDHFAGFVGENDIDWIRSAARDEAM